MTVRLARPEDRGTLSSLHGLLSHPSPELFDAWPAVGTLLVSVDSDDHPVGYLLGVGDHLAELVVAPDARREGRATALVEAYQARHSDASLTLLVHPENEGARACYDALGFRHDERVGDAFDGDDAIRLVYDG
ncbi:GNAT family N-acetyltransferase [Haloferax sp. MBLA0076]|uniref:GNAT family N-acetyltransferase n=1 Tax=Haloferax litoreum TaxID=2666140 RepID=A0A6A8GFH1_9EURY|nr:MULTISPECIES: GNAT family N-acetyltransferase [Haloferax]KAB1194824.1 GNAT family N-acetyltransferase [Haloferax sp. CBA1148]MRX21903.1 GNAT family N-acetyltransferase [Haloferax litoreum]